MRDPATGSDAAFFRFLRATRETFEAEPLTTEQFRALAEKYVVPAANLDKRRSLEWFFDQWVYSTGIPEVQVKCEIAGTGVKRRAHGSIVLEGVDEAFSLPVPIYAQSPRGRTLLGIVSAVGKETKFSFPLTSVSQRVVADPGGTLLAVIKQ